MKLIVKNPSSDSYSYINGTITINSASELNVNSIYWYSLYTDSDFQKDLKLQNIIISDGISDYRFPESQQYIEKLLTLSIGNRDSVGSPITVINSQPAYGSKTFISNGQVKKLFARFSGIQVGLEIGTNEISYTVPFAWAKIIGIEVVGCENLDTASLKVYDSATGTYSGVPDILLNQFCFDINLPKDFYSRMAQFDADVYQGMIIKIDYNSKSAKTVGINFLINEVKN